MATTVSTFDRLVMENGGNPPTQAQLIAALAKLEDKAIRKEGQVDLGGKLYARIGDKGTVSVYALGRFPVSLYAEQWERLNAQMPQLMDFIHDNIDRLATKVRKVEASE